MEFEQNVFESRCDLAIRIDDRFEQILARAARADVREVRARGAAFAVDRVAAHA